ncbi:hypothetical protein [Hyalangium versicolor]|uniref:hypothetical protein n=1 Tax=Hyalangium versicolor TaxID=2861190 RepID=UPI001CCE6680|nr:hypothetical protein [Hyalangium versicolor]
MSEPLHIRRSATFLDFAVATLGIGTLYLAIMGLVATEMSGAMSVAFLTLAAGAGLGSSFLLLRRRWAWILCAVVAAVITVAGVAVIFLEDVRWIGALHAVVGAGVLGALWTGRPALIPRSKRPVRSQA